MHARRPLIPAARARLLTLLVAVVSGVGVSGCGQAQQVRDALDYSADVNRVLTGFERDLQELRQRADDAKNPADVDQAVRRLSGSVDGVETGLQRVKPPASVAGLHRDLIAAFRRWSAPLQRFEAALKTRKTRVVFRGQAAFVRDTDAIQRDVGATAARINARLRRLSD